MAISPILHFTALPLFFCRLKVAIMITVTTLT